MGKIVSVFRAFDYNFENCAALLPNLSLVHSDIFGSNQVQDSRVCKVKSHKVDIEHKFLNAKGWDMSESGK